MLIVTPKLDDYRVGAGEPFILSVVFRDSQNNPLDMTDRRVVLSFYRSSGRGLFAAIDGVPAGDGILQFVRPGVFTADLYGQGLTVSLSERLLNGRETFATGKLTVAATADPVESFGALIGRAEVRATVYLDDLGIPARWGDLIRLPYASDGAPVIYTPAAINSDPTPQVGETFTLVRPTGNGPVAAERLLENGVDVWSAVSNLQFTARAAGSLRYEADLQGPDGNIATSGSTITVAAATVPITITGTPPTTGTVGQPYSFMPSTANGSGAKVFSLASGTLLAGLSLSATTGAITGTPTAAGTMTALSVRVTDDTGGAATTPTTVTIAAATAPGAVTVDPIVQRSGQQYTFTARRSGDLSQAASRTMQVAASTDYPPGSPASDWPGGAYATATANFPAGSATAPFTITAPVAAQPE